MADELMTLDDMAGGKLDLNTLKVFANGDENTVNYPRLLPNVDVGSIAELRKKVTDDAKANVDEQLKVLPSGHKGYATLALAQAAQASLAANTLVEVTNDTTTANNGVYLWNGTMLTKSTYDPKTAAVAETKTYTDTSLKSYAKTYNTLAELNAVTGMTAGQVAKVMNDTTTANNGDYRYTGSAWVKGYDPLTDAKSYATAQANAAQANAISAAALNADATAKAVFKANDAGQYFDASAFSIAAYYNINGQYNAGSPFLQTGFIAVKKGDVITASTGMPANYPWAVMFDTSQTRIGNLGVTTERVFKERTATVTQDGFVVIQHASTIEPTDVPKFELNKGKPKYVELVKLADNDVIKAKADNIKLNFFTDFEVGGVTVAGNKTSETDRIRSKNNYKLKAGTVIKFSKISDKYLFGVGAISEADYAAGKSPYTAYVSNSASLGYTFTVTADKPYVMLFVKSSTGGINPITVSDIPTILSDVKIWTEESVSYTSPIVVVTSASNNKVYLPPITTPSSFRTPSLATGGVISFIDDDGKALVSTELHAFMKNQSVPYGEAIIPDRLNTAEYMTTEQFLQLASEQAYVEILDHTFSHVNMTGITKAEIESSILKSKKFFAENGVVVDSLVYPFGGDNESVRAIVSKYYQSAYDYGGEARVETFNTISNRSIKRTTWQGNVDTVAYHKTKIDEAASTNGWLVVCLHVGAGTYWYENSYTELAEVIAYARTKGLKFVMPRDGFQIFGNIAENDSGFKIQANGKIVGAT